MYNYVTDKIYERRCLSFMQKFLTVGICRTKMLDKAYRWLYNKAHQRSSGIDHRQVRREFPLLIILL